MTIEKDGRRYSRFKAPKPVLVAWMRGTEKHVSREENLAMGGLFVYAQDSPPVGTSLQLLFNTPEGEVRLRAIVRNLVAGRGMGLGIVSMEPEHRTRLDRWMKRLSGIRARDPAWLTTRPGGNVLVFYRGRHSP